jgi:signal transduction histidine kinase
VKVQPADLVETVDDFLRAHGRFADRGLVEWLRPAERVPVALDPVLFRQVLQNLIDNAFESSPGGGAGVALAARVDGPRAVLEITDNGPGVTAEEARRIFEPYYTTKDTGAGLGLAIARKVVLEHGGELDVRPLAPGRGATFRITLPLLADAKPSRAPETA